MSVGFLEQKAIDRTNWSFDKQIQKQPFYDLHKQLFNLSIHLTLADWKQIRSGDYWERHDKLKTHEDRLFLTLERVNDYLN